MGESSAWWASSEENTKLRWPRKWAATSSLIESRRTIFGRMSNNGYRIFVGFDYIFDANGVATLQRSYDNLAATGKLIVFGFHTMLPHSGRISPWQWLKLGVNAFKTPSFSPLKMVTENKSVCGFNLSFLFRRIDILRIGMANVMPWIESG